ncbi:MAG: hypothetical protein AAF629_01995 [Chloroflexota bacterium]
MDAPRKVLPLAVIVLTVLAFGLRFSYALQSNPFIDEFTTVFASQMILQHGWPILPSGLFYEHGILFSYLATPFVAMAGKPPVFLIARLSSVLIGTALVPVLYYVGRRWFTPTVGLMAATLFVFSPEGIVWGGRIRMYALAQLLILLLAFFAYEGTLTANRHRARWLTIIILLALLLTQLGGLLFVPPLLIALAAMTWLTNKNSSLIQRLNPFSILEWVAFVGVIGAGVLIKRLGQPLGAVALGSGESGNPIQALWYTIAYQTGIVLDYQSTIKFLARQFGVPHHYWLIIIALAGLCHLFFSIVKDRDIKQHRRPLIFLWIVFGLVVLEMITVLQPFRRNPRYLVMGLPLFYLIVAGGLETIRSRLTIHMKGSAPYLYGFLIAGILALHGQALWTDVRIAYQTPETAYDRAFQYVAAHRQPDDIVLTMNPTPAALYLDQLDFFAMQSDADQFLLNRETIPIDRWLGRPWLGTAAAFNRVINQHPQVWFVVDTIRLPVYYRGDWQALLQSQMDLVWAEDEALVYRTKLERHPIPDTPDFLTNINFDHQITLQGHSQTITPATSDAEGRLHLTLFWQAETNIDTDYTIFVHIRDQDGMAVAQKDSQPINGKYPSSRWQIDETVIDQHTIPLSADLSSGTYQIWAGLYQLENLARLAVVDDASGENAVLLGDIIIP